MSVNKLQNVFLRIDKPTIQQQEQPSNQLHLMSLTHTHTPREVPVTEKEEEQ